MDDRYLVITNIYPGKSISQLINEAAADGWRYVDTIGVYHYKAKAEYTILMAKEEHTLAMPEPQPGFQQVDKPRLGDKEWSVSDAYSGTRPDQPPEDTWSGQEKAATRPAYYRIRPDGLITSHYVRHYGTQAEAWEALDFINGRGGTVAAYDEDDKVLAVLYVPFATAGEPE